MREPVDAFDYEKQLIYGADYKDHLHEIKKLDSLIKLKLNFGEISKQLKKYNE